MLFREVIWPEGSFIIRMGVVAALSLILIPNAVFGQIAVRQGTEQDLEPRTYPLNPNRFNSPMVIELELKDYAALPMKKNGKSQIMENYAIRRYNCDDVRIDGIEIQREILAGNGSEIMRIKGTTYTYPRRDKLVTIRFEIVFGNRLIAGARVDSIDAEADKYRSFRAMLEYPKEVMRFMEAAKLRITLAVADNAW